jgi:hypothetical protein
VIEHAANSLLFIVRRNYDRYTIHATLAHLPGL